MKRKFWFSLILAGVALAALPFIVSAVDNSGQIINSIRCEKLVMYSGDFGIGRIGTQSSPVPSLTVTSATFGAVRWLKQIITVTTNTALSAAQCAGTVIYLGTAQSATTITLTMPTLAAGYDVTFVDNDVRGGADLKIQMGTGDKINGGTAAKAYTHGNASTAVGTARFVAVDDTDFVLMGTPTDSGNWKNNNS